MPHFAVGVERSEFEGVLLNERKRVADKREINGRPHLFDGVEIRNLGLRSRLVHHFFRPLLFPLRRRNARRPTLQLHPATRTHNVAGIRPLYSGREASEALLF